MADVSLVMSRYVITPQYCALLAGYKVTQAELSLLVNSADWPSSCEDEERAALLFEELAQWLACMDRCPMFVQDGGRAHG